MKCNIEKLDWTTAYFYKLKEKPETIDLTLPFETMREICSKWDLYPELGAREASYQAFCDWVRRHHKTREKFYGHMTGFDIDSLVDIFDRDLRKTAILHKKGEVK